ncbi:hypothetical protein DENSPDRAFT_821253 [Dentipellis sp. KUC8613]|nr:hypothetical protein DENSPDRAFT_821253 [Dentipellis sp. KUC8613]
MTVGNPVFKFGRQTYAVTVENIPRTVNGREIIELFNTLVGKIKTAESNDNGASMQLTFYTEDAATKSLCMSGYTVAGVPLSVTAVTQAKINSSSNLPRSSDTRRNLYVLGLPFELSKAEFTGLFSRYGTVTHCVILATVDNASRRRGFVVMSSNSEARAAMEAISRTEIKGSIVDVSWAVVQRSQGFLDGGDRTMSMDNRFDSPPCTNSSAGSTPEPSFQDPRTYPFQDISNDQNGFNNAIVSRPCRVMVSNLPKLLFADASDVEPLFLPFGKVENLELLPAQNSDSCRGVISVVASYMSAASALEAKQVLHGQNYAGFTVQAKLLAPWDQRQRTSFSGVSVNSRGSGLNPHASPFVYGNASPLSFSAPPTCSIVEERKDYFGGVKEKTPLFFDNAASGQRLGLGAFAQTSLPASTVPSRTNSAASL